MEAYRSSSIHDCFWLVVLANFLHPELKHEVCLIDLAQMLRVGLTPCTHVMPIRFCQAGLVWKTKVWLTYSLIQCRQQSSLVYLTFCL